MSMQGLRPTGTLRTLGLPNVSSQAIHRPSARHHLLATARQILSWARAERSASMSAAKPTDDAFAWPSVSRLPGACPRSGRVERAQTSQPQTGARSVAWEAISAHDEGP